MNNQRNSATRWQNAVSNPISTGDDRLEVKGGSGGVTTVTSTGEVRRVLLDNTPPVTVTASGGPAVTRTVMQGPQVTTFAQQNTPQLGSDSNVFGSINLNSNHKTNEATAARMAEGSRFISQTTTTYEQTATHNHSTSPNKTVTFQTVTQGGASGTQSVINGGTRTSGMAASLTGETRTSMRVGEGRLVSERVGESRIVGEVVGEKRVIESHALQPRVVEERTVTGQTKVVSEVEGRKTRQSEKHEVHVKDVEVEIVKRDRVFEIVKEKPVKVERVVDVPYDVVVDVPVERTIEREKITNIVREIPIEKIVEVPIEQIYEIPVEKIIERPVEVQKFVEVPRERIVEKPYDVIRENVVYQDRFVDVEEADLAKFPNFERLPTQVRVEEKTRVIEQPRMVEQIVEKIVPVETRRVIEVPREVVVENRQQVVVDRPHPVEKIIRREVNVPVERQVYKEVPVAVERPVYRENIIEVPVPVERVVEHEVTVPVDRVREKKVLIEKLIENPVEHIVEVPVPREEIVEELVDQVVEEPFEITRAQLRPQEKVIRKSAVSVKQVQVPKEYSIDKLVARPVANTIDKKVNRYSERRVEMPIERPTYVERIVEVPKIVEKIIEVPVEVVREQIRFVEKVIEKPVYIDTVIDKFVEVIVEKVVEVPVEKIVEVEVEVVIEVPEIEEVDLREDVVVEGVHETYTEAPTVESAVDFEDELLAEQIKLRQLEVDSLARKNRELAAELARTQQDIERVAATLSSEDERLNFKLLATFAELNSRYRMEVEHGHALRDQKNRGTRIIEPQVQVDPRVAHLRSRIEALVTRNQQLVAQVQTSSDATLKRVRLSQFRA